MPAFRWSSAPALIVTLPSEWTVLELVGVRVMVPAVDPQNGMPAQSPFCRESAVVGGIGEMTAGSGIVICCGSETRAQSGSGVQPSTADSLPLPANCIELQ